MGGWRGEGLGVEDGFPCSVPTPFPVFVYFHPGDGLESLYWYFHVLLPFFLSFLFFFLIKAKLIFFMQRFLKTMASFLQKLFLTVSNGIAFCGEEAAPGGVHRLGFLKVFHWKEERRGLGNCLKFPLDYRPWAQMCLESVEHCPVLTMNLKSRPGGHSKAVVL